MSDKSLAPDVRIGALKAMAAHKDPHLADAVRSALTDTKPALRREAINLEISLPDAVSHLDALLTSGSVSDQQAVFNTLALVQGPAIDQILSNWMDKLLAGKVAPEVALDLLDAPPSPNPRPSKTSSSSTRPRVPKTTTWPPSAKP